MNKIRIPIKRIALNTAKAGLKAFVIYLVYFIFTMIVKPYLEMVGEYNVVISEFFIILLGFTIIADILSDTLYCYMVRMVRDLLLVLYLIASLHGGLITATIQDVRVAVNLQFFLSMVVLINMLNFAKNMLNIINFVNEKAERSVLQPSLIQP